MLDRPSIGHNQLEHQQGRLECQNLDWSKGALCTGAVRREARRPEKPVGSVLNDVSPCEDEESAFSTEDPGSDENASSDSDLKSDYSDESDVSHAAVRYSQKDTILIFDWDDTICPSTQIELQTRLPLFTEEALATDFSGLAEKVARTLEIAKQHGTVVLVTNAEKGWIELSCQRYLPSLFQNLSNVKILSARSTYEAQGVKSPTEWKLLAFENEIKDFCGNCSLDGQKNVISFGDSMHEREALFRATATMENTARKSVKFIERPNVEQLTRQHELLIDHFRQIVDHEGNMDLCLRCS